MFMYARDNKISIILEPQRRAAGVVDRGRLEICCTALRYRGFESLALRLKNVPAVWREHFF